MNLKGIFADTPAFKQILILLALIVLGAIFGSVIGFGLLYILCGPDANIIDHPSIMRLFQLLSSIFTFLFPAFMLSFLCSKTPSKYLFIKNIPNGHILLLVFLSIILITPIITLSGFVNKLLTLPSFLAPIENWMIAQEKNAESLTLLMLGDGNILSVISNLIVIALGAAITEEFLFRGAIFRILQHWSKKPSMIIWFSAIIFSAFHIQFFGFIPRLLLGAWFGYLLFWSQNIWIPVFAHFCNNAMAVILMSNVQLKDNQFVTGDLSHSTLIPYSILALITIPLFLLCAKAIKSNLKIE